MNRLTNQEAMLAISAAISSINAENGLDIAHHFTSVGNGGYSVELMDRDVKDALLAIDAKNAISKSKFKLLLGYELFDGGYINPDLDDPAGVKMSDSTEKAAGKRCKYLIWKTYEQFKDKLKIVDKNFMISEVKQIVKQINDVKKLQIEIVAFKWEVGSLLVYLTEKRVDQNGDNANTSVHIDSGYYTEEDTVLDDMIGTQHIKFGDQYWKYNGKLRVSYLIFNTIALWLKNKHKDVYDEIKGAK